MALKRTTIAKGTAPVLTSYASGLVMVQRARFAFTETFTAASDKLEMFCLPAGCVPIRFTIWGTGGSLGTLNVVAGLVTGDFGSDDNARTVGAEILTATAIGSSAVVEATKPLLDLIAADQTKHRGVGITLSVNVSAGVLGISAAMEYVAV